MTSSFGGQYSIQLSYGRVSPKRIGARKDTVITGDRAYVGRNWCAG